MNIGLQIVIDINNLKTTLTRRAKKKGIWENFGQEEVNKLKDKHIGLNCVTREIYQLFTDFDNWCMNFNDRDLRGL